MGLAATRVARQHRNGNATANPQPPQRRGVPVLSLYVTCRDGLRVQWIRGGAFFWSRVGAFRAFCARSERVGVSVSVRMNVSGCSNRSM